MSQEQATPQPEAQVPARVPTDEEVWQALFLEGDISKMNPGARAKYCWKLAESVGLNPLTKPFDIINLGGKTIVYANRTAADQIRKNQGITSKVIYTGPLMIGDKIREDVYCVMVELMDKDKRTETAIGCVNILNYQGEALANQIMKCWTKAMRRGTLSMGGLGFLDEIEVDTVRGSDNAPAEFQPTLPKAQPQPTLAPSPVVVEAVTVELPKVTLPGATPAQPAEPAARGPRPLPSVKPPAKGV